MDYYYNHQASIPVDLSSVEAHLARGLTNYRPDSGFKAELKSRLAQSRVFERRRELGARWVGAFTVLLVAILAYLVRKFFSRSCSPVRPQV